MLIEWVVWVETYTKLEYGYNICPSTQKPYFNKGHKCITYWDNNNLSRAFYNIWRPDYMYRQYFLIYRYPHLGISYRLNPNIGLVNTDNYYDMNNIKSSIVFIYN